MPSIVILSIIVIVLLLLGHQSFQETLRNLLRGLLFALVVLLALYTIVMHGDGLRVLAEDFAGWTSSLFE